MRIILDITPTEKNNIDLLIAAGRYSSFQEFLTISVKNQFKLEAQPESADNLISQSHNISDNLKQDLIETSEGLPSKDIILVEEPTIEEIYDSKLWSLHNRIFPIKLTVRLLAKLVANHGIEGYVESTLLEDSVTKEAIKLANLLTKVDGQQKVDQKMAAGLVYNTDSKS